MVGYALLFNRRLDALLGNKQTAESLGVSVVRLRNITFLIASLSTALLVSITGVIGFIGLMIPHPARETDDRLWSSRGGAAARKRSTRSHNSTTPGTSSGCCYKLGWRPVRCRYSLATKDAEWLSVLSRFKLLKSLTTLVSLMSKGSIMDLSHSSQLDCSRPMC
ncbi:hypothetical protein J2W42_006662 [Rhizobium tibeticum]|nr:hypothetical protein [Rhizobium tibeticum]